MPSGSIEGSGACLMSMDPQLSCKKQQTRTRICSSKLLIAFFLYILVSICLGVSDDGSVHMSSRHHPHSSSAPAHTYTQLHNNNNNNNITNTVETRIIYDLDESLVSSSDDTVYHNIDNNDNNDNDNDNEEKEKEKEKEKEENDAFDQLLEGLFSSVSEVENMEKSMDSMGMDYAKRIGEASSVDLGDASEYLEDWLYHMSFVIPDQSFKTSGFDASVTAMECSQITIKDITSGHGNTEPVVKVGVTGLGIRCSAKWSYKYASWPYVPSGKCKCGYDYMTKGYILPNMTLH
jgi:hypothetical protein